MLRKVGFNEEARLTYRSITARRRSCDYLKISGDYVEKIYQFAMRSLNEDGLVAKSSLDNGIRLAREQLKVKDEVPESKVAEWKFLKEILAKK